MALEASSMYRAVLMTMYTACLILMLQLIEICLTCIRSPTLLMTEVMISTEILGQALDLAVAMKTIGTVRGVMGMEVEPRLRKVMMTPMTNSSHIVLILVPLTFIPGTCVPTIFL